MASVDRATLVTLFQATGGATWRRKTNWGTDAELSDWYGVTVNSQGRVVKLILNLNNLEGSIPKELGALSKLEELNLYGNKLISGGAHQGSIPKEVEALTNLGKLDLSFNQLSGPIPRELGNLTALTELWLSNNNLEGSIPEELGALVKLTHLGLKCNRLIGPIPVSLGALSKLQWLMLQSNHLTGPIPESLGALSKLHTLSIHSNQLTGSVPKLGGLSKLVELSLYDNKLTALWDLTRDINGAGCEEQRKSQSVRGVPEELRRLLDAFDRTSYLSLGNNPWVEPPESVVGQGPKSIRGYVEDLYAEPSRIQRSSVKIVLVGQAGAGKTSLRQSMKANEAAPTGEWREESTVFADVEPMELEGTSVRVYDCAGQVAYTGLLQMFLTPRSICLLVCNAEAFYRQQHSDEGTQQLTNDVRKLEMVGVLDWLRCISQRVPENDVILVATKCDLVARNAKRVGKRIEHACLAWRGSWVRHGMQPVRVEDGVSLTSCSTVMGGQGKRGDGDHNTDSGWPCDWREASDDRKLPSLLHRVVNKPNGAGLRGARMVLPNSWNIALIVLEALELGRDPVEMVSRQKLSVDDGEGLTGMAQSEENVYHGITMEELNAKWQETVFELDRRDIKITNAKNALEGALSIREFDGSLVRHEMFVFLDVVWLARILKPLLNHKDEETFDGFVNLGDTGGTRITLEAPTDIASWHRLKNEGILEPRLARAIWPKGLSDYVLPTLKALGLTFPLAKDPAEGLVVLLRLEPGRPERVGKVVDTFCSAHTPALSVSWKIFLGVPPGAMEKVLTRCCSLGGVRTFWRSGVLVHGGLEDGNESGIFAVVLQYVSSSNEVTAQVYGDIGSPAPWAALSYIISAIKSMLQEYPGLRSRGHVECPQHGDRIPLADTVTPLGGRLVLETAGCPQCSLETRGQGAAAAELLRMVDIRLDRGTTFHEVSMRLDRLVGRYSFPHRKIVSQEHSMLVQKVRDLNITMDRVEVGIERVEGGIRRVEGGIGRVEEGIRRVEGGIREALMSLKSLQAPNYPYPHLVVVKEINSGGSLTSPGKRSLLGRLRGVAMKDMTLHFLCPVDMSKVPCGVGGEGYRFRETRGWVKKLAPVLQVAVVTAKVALKAATTLDVDLSEFLSTVCEDQVENLVEGTLDEDELFRYISGEDDVNTGMQRSAWASYEVLKKFMDKETRDRSKNTKDEGGYVDFQDTMQQVEDGQGGMVWVRTENVQKWQASHSAAAPPR